jgi:hypothetical protein
MTSTGGNADETVRFALDGVEYAIDLSSKNATILRKGLDGLLDVARRVGRMSSDGRRETARGARPNSASNRERNQTIRDWAKSKGLEVSDRGRISQDLVDQYEAEVDK